MSKFCRYCGTALVDEAVFCAKCGRECADMARQPAARQPAAAQPVWQAPAPQAPPPKKKAGLLIAAAIVVVLAALAVTALWKPGFLRSKLPFFDDGEETLSEPASPSPKPTPRATTAPTETPRATGTPTAEPTSEPTAGPTPEETPEPTPFVNPFDDVPEDKYYYEPVMWAARNGLTGGTHFRPADPCTRAQAVTMMWRAAGSPASSSIAQLYSDVEEGDYYYEACMWAYNVGITAATPGGTFRPDEAITRAQITTFLYRLVGEKVEAENPFTDVKESDYFYDAALWAGEKGIIGPSATFDPQGVCSRGNAVTFLYRAMKDRD